MGNGMNKILPGLYLGNFRDAKDQNQLQANGITHIISIHESPKPFYMDKKYLCITATDTSGQNISQHFSQANDFIHEARLTGGNVLVHCLAGVSRSTTIVIAYLMTITGLTWKDCLAAVQFSRSCANPNFGFQRQLLEFHYENMDWEQKRLLKKFPSSNFTKDMEEVKTAIDAHKKKLREKEHLREDVCKILNRSSQSVLSTSDPIANNENDDANSIEVALKTIQSSSESIQSASCQDILSNLDTLLSE